MELIKVIIMVIILFKSIDGIKFEHMPEPAEIIFSEHAITYISYNKWQICYYYDLIEYYDEVKKFNICIQQMRLICNKINKLEYHLENIRNEAETIKFFQNANYRSKRAPFEFIGEINNLLFGLMDAR